MRAESTRTRESVSRVTASVRSTSWRGHDAERFQGLWRHHERVIRSASDQLEDAAEDLERHAVEQMRASDSVTDTTNSHSIRTPVEPMAGPAPTSSMESTGRDPGPPPLGDPLPLRTESWEIGGALAAGLGIGGAARITVTELPGGLFGVSLEDVDAATVSGGASADIGVDGGPGLELGADAHAELAVHTRDAWYVDSEELSGLLSRLGLREFVGAGILSPGIPGGSGVGLGFVFDKATDLLGLGAPEPELSERLITLGGAVGISAAVGIPLLGASGAVAESVGTRARGGDLALVVGGRTDCSTRFPGGGPSGAASFELEIPVGGRDPQHMVMTTTNEVVGGERLERAVYRFDGDRAAGHARDAVRAVGSGDVERAGDALAALWAEVDLQPIWSDAVGGIVDNDVKTVDVGVALGPDLSGSVTGGRRIVTYQR